ncbi:MAG: hypothetical protein U0P30_04090 [Vicinamibacterales bacterium]
MAGLVTLPLAVLPRAPSSVCAMVISTIAGNSMAIGLPLNFCTFTTRLSVSSSLSSPIVSDDSVSVSNVVSSMKWKPSPSEY